MGHPMVETDRHLCQRVGHLDTGETAVLLCVWERPKIAYSNLRVNLLRIDGELLG